MTSLHVLLGNKDRRLWSLSKYLSDKLLPQREPFCPVSKTVVFGTPPAPLPKEGAFSYIYPPLLHSVSTTTRITA